ncbi:class I SAM-dependent methyltransferase [Virgibacillus soli]|uniref:Class I SAM-dependent methyltransferase n=1 Tax=Paracerasibacillus soli TaxID=480284 RepID=A0ABU5CQQ4_9BACI|nr:class I SAM-dependent methyltransferase [Virgibacillus soli]MDY0408669.1 class I SAM-dependent methyltransferase [Virgibacillus soli]
MEVSHVNTLFTWMDHVATIIEQHEKEPYLDSLAHAMNVLFQNQTDHIADDLLSHKLNGELEKIQIDQFSTIEIRKAVQLAILKGMKDTTQQQHLITPESVAMFVGYIVEKLFAQQEKVMIFDPACGTSNLLTTVISQLENKTIEAYGSEVDPTLVQLSLQNANLQEMEIEYFHQDSLRPFLLDPVDLVVTDLPVGYYPDDVRASQFELKADEGHSYAHHLFIEQSITYTREGGYLIFIVPNFMFDGVEANKLHAFLKEKAVIIGLLQLPESMFKVEKNAKSIFIIQKKGEQVQQVKQPLLAKLPSFNNTKAMEDMLSQLNAWFKDNLAERS